MKTPIIFLMAMMGVFCFASEVPASMKPWKSKVDMLSDLEKHVIIDKGTERAYTGEYVYTKEDGIYRCKVCDDPSLYR